MSLTFSFLQSKNQRLWIRMAAIGLCAAFYGAILIGCTKKEESPEIGRLKAQWAASIKRMEEMELEIKTSRDDAATSAVLAEEKELLKSRMERLKEKLIGHGAMDAAAPAGGGGGGHH